MTTRKSLNIIFFILFLTGCSKITVTTGKWEKSNEFKVEYNIKPSDLIRQFISDSIALDNKSDYFLVFYDIYCPYSYQQINYCNKLYNQTKSDFKWIAITIYDIESESKFRHKMKYDSNFQYQFQSYHQINGLKSSLRNLYYHNDIPDRDITPMNIVIANDSIVQIIRGAINTNLKYDFYKEYLDSIIISSDHKKMNNKN
jgi:hypothetical protein